MIPGNQAPGKTGIQAPVIHLHQLHPGPLNLLVHEQNSCTTAVLATTFFLRRRKIEREVRRYSITPKGETTIAADTIQFNKSPSSRAVD